VARAASLHTRPHPPPCHTPLPPAQIIAFVKPAAGGAKVVKEYDGKRELADFVEFLSKNGVEGVAGAEDDDDLEL
jgi:hypothetical protein